MRLENPLLLASLGVLLAAASCTLITDVDRSKIPDGQAGEASGGTGTTEPQGGDGNTPLGGTPGSNGGEAGVGTLPQGGGGAGPDAGGAGAGGVPGTDGGAGGVPSTDGGAGGVPGTDGGAGGAGGATP